MRSNPQISTVALAAVVGMASTSGVEKHLKALREAGCIRRAGPAKGGTWEVVENVL
jgi:ATP-dependent DNA helicase RecG